MDTLIYTKIAQVLKLKVPELRWIDLDMGQLDSNTRPAVAFPCLLVTTAITGADTFYQSHTGYGQNCRATVTVTLAFEPLGATNTAAPDSVVATSLSPYAVIDKVHKALQGVETDTMEPLLRISQGKKRSRNKLFQYEIRFATTVLDEA